ncbi:unnamed protein product [Ceutorhynchus assimilis]|uniref:Uncharacterized protein n=1 Tax=Ceutorhynchus assimilis TaxID=467358 RepID=A0A9N9MRJ4_9CUCU|nr:unnamed protein product [Ceutorhynchus assimilis]
MSHKDAALGVFIDIEGIENTIVKWICGVILGGRITTSSIGSAKISSNAARGCSIALAVVPSAGWAASHSERGRYVHSRLRRYADDLVIVVARKPEALSNCSISNQTSDSIYIECSGGFDGGLPQLFILEVYEMRHEKLVSNMTSEMPVFVVMGLESGACFDIILYAANKKGRSSLTHLMGFTLSGIEKSRDFFPVLLQITPLLGILVGVVGTLIIIAVIIVIVLRLRGGGGRDDKTFTDRGLSIVGRSMTEINNDKHRTHILTDRKESLMDGGA